MQGAKCPLYMARTCALLTKTKGFPDGKKGRKKCLSAYEEGGNKFFLKSRLLRVFDMRAFAQQAFYTNVLYKRFIQMYKTVVLNNCLSREIICFIEDIYDIII